MYMLIAMLHHPRLSTFTTAALFELCTTEGWFDVMHVAVDSTGIGMQPVRGTGLGWVLFFIFYIIVGAFFMINLFVGNVIEQYEKMNDDDDDNPMELTEDAEGRAEIFKLFRGTQPRYVLERPTNIFRALFFDLSEWSVFENGIMLCIVLNTIVMMLTRFDDNPELIAVWENINIVFAIIFTLEAAIKLIAYKTRYFYDSCKDIASSPPPHLVPANTASTARSFKITLIYAPLKTPRLFGPVLGHSRFMCFLPHLATHLSYLPAPPVLRRHCATSSSLAHREHLRFLGCCRDPPRLHTQVHDPAPN